MGKEIIVEDKRNDSYKLVLKIELDEEDEQLLKKDLIYSLYLQNWIMNKAKYLKHCSGITGIRIVKSI